MRAFTSCLHRWIDHYAGRHLRPFGTGVEVNSLVGPGREGRRMPGANPVIQAQLTGIADQCDYALGVSTGTLILTATEILKENAKLQPIG